MTETPPALRLLESRLRVAARAFAERAVASVPVFGASPRLVLARLAPDLSIEEAEAPETLPAMRRGALMKRLRREDARLARLARAADARYDLNRHIALRRLLCRLESGKGAATAGPGPLSGHELNRRFTRRRSPVSGQPATLRSAGTAASDRLPSLRNR